MLKDEDRAAEAARFEQELRRYPDVYFDYLSESVQFANIARYEMQALFIYRTGQDLDEFFRSLNEFLSNAANVSRILWDEGRSEERHIGKVRTRVLQEILGLNAEHSLSRRPWRNHIAHYETRIDKWLLESRNHNIARRIVGPIGRVIAGIEDHEIFEQYDPSEHIFYFRGDKYPINEIHSDLNQIAGLARAHVRRRG